ncbi:serine/threonine-protein kinase [Allonocardiopsis opalescens]|uniref:non-specific serine/threonine protein kinase n=1 Tax=Allonocardiopsis opalescens TaxID=1144618 RepID=A0A2T0Q7A5_9ACTN|nr:serine/threonine-protein kinase [Allonocardiopsis opalescens]PRX99603.1 serine/threonine-protein kinase [Allonocardiopsis opalescens]
MSAPPPLLANRYRLEERIAAGGMGEVWAAADTVLDRQVAVKLLKHALIGDRTYRSRFRSEARITAALGHPGIAQVYDYGEQDDMAFLVMELVPGEPLSSVVARHGALAAETVLDIVHQAARALAAAHAAGVVHRDIKPANLLMTREGVLKLTDFGIARAAESVTLTQTGMVMGTAQYVSPEQANGDPTTPSSDLYSLGVVAYECLTGRPPFTSASPLALAVAHIRESPPPLPASVPGPVAELVLELLAKQPASRPRGADELAERTAALRASLRRGADPAAAAPAPAAGLAEPSDPTTWFSADTPTSDLPAGGSARPRRSGLPLLLGTCAVLAVVGMLLAGLLMRGDGVEGQSIGNEGPFVPAEVPSWDPSAQERPGVGGPEPGSRPTAEPSGGAGAPTGVVPEPSEYPAGGGDGAGEAAPPQPDSTDPGTGADTGDGAPQGDPQPGQEPENPEPDETATLSPRPTCSPPPQGGPCDTGQ